MQSQFVKMAENVDSDAEFLAAMNVFGLPIPEEYTHTPEEKGREVVKNWQWQSYRTAHKFQP